MRPQALPSFFKNHDAALLLLAGLALFAEVGWLLHQLRLIQIPFLLSQQGNSSPAIGKVVEKTYSVLNRGPGSLTWYPVVEGDSLHDNDTLMTGVSATARVQIQDDAELVMEPFSLLRIGRSTQAEEESLQLEAYQGVVKIRSQRVGVRVLASNTEIVIAPNSEVALKYVGKKPQSAIEVLKGGAEVGSLDLKAGQRTSFSEQRAPSAVEPRPEANYKLLGTPSERRVKQGASILLAWAPVSQAEGYLVELSRDPKFEKVDEKWEVDKPHVEVSSLLPGRYFWRLRARSADWGEWPASPAFSIEVKAPIEAPKPKGAKEIHKGGNPAKRKVQGNLWRPKNRWSFVWSLWQSQALAKSKAEVEMEFSWEPLPSARAYRLEVGDTRDFKTPLASIKVEQTDAVLSLPPRENYYWRVAGIDADGDLGLFTPVQKMRREEPKETVISSASKPAPVPAPVQIAKQPKSRTPTLSRSVASTTDAPEYSRLWVGYGGSYSEQSASGALSLVRSAGFPLHRVTVGGALDLNSASFELHAWYQPMNYKSRATQPSFPMGQLAASFLASRLGRVAGLPWGVGFALRGENYFTALSDTSVAMRSTSFAALLLGTNWEVPGKWYWRGGLWLEVGAVGEKRGAGLILRNRLGLPVQWKELRPSVDVVVHPQFRTAQSVASSEWNWEVAVSFVLEWSSVFGVSSVANLN